jgi:hypothetical protein
MKGGSGLDLVPLKENMQLKHQGTLIVDPAYREISLRSAAVALAIVWKNASW